MTDETEAPAIEGEKLSDFWERLHSEGVDMKHVHQMLDRVRRERAEAIANAARLYYRDTAGEPITGDLGDKLHEMVSRCWGLFVAFTGYVEERNDSYTRGILQLAEDVALEMERIETAFSAERDLESTAEQEA
ncbi:MAG: hypothetical protein ACLPSW_12885 [Roseiarcus sp.]